MTQRHAPQARSRLSLAGPLVVSIGLLVMPQAHAGQYEYSFHMLKADPLLKQFNEPEPEVVHQDPMIDLPTTAQSDADSGYVLIVDQDLRSLVTQFAQEKGLTPQISANLRQNLVNVRLPLDTKGFINTLQQRYNLTTYIQGGKLVVASQGEVVTRIIPLGDISYNALLNQLRTASVGIDPHDIKMLKESNSIMVSAPAEVVAQIAGILDSTRNSAPGSKVRMVRYGINRTEALK